MSITQPVGVLPDVHAAIRTLAASKGIAIRDLVDRWVVGEIGESCTPVPETPGTYSFNLFAATHAATADAWTAFAASLAGMSDADEGNKLALDMGTMLVVERRGSKVIIRDVSGAHSLTIAAAAGLALSQAIDYAISFETLAPDEAAFEITQ